MESLRFRRKILVMNVIFTTEYLKRSFRFGAVSDMMEGSRNQKT